MSSVEALACDGGLRTSGWADQQDVLYHRDQTRV
jgi:hypothetical protein